MALGVVTRRAGRGASTGMTASATDADAEGQNLTSTLISYASLVTDPGTCGPEPRVHRATATARPHPAANLPWSSRDCQCEPRLHPQVHQLPAMVVPHGAACRVKRFSTRGLAPRPLLAS